VIRKKAAVSSFVVMKEKTVLVASTFTRSSSPPGRAAPKAPVLCQSWKLLSRIWEDHLADNPPQPGELSGAFQDQLQAAQRDEAQANVKGTQEIDNTMFMGEHEARTRSAASRRRLPWDSVSKSRTRTRSSARISAIL